jgi:hypothetical protein
LTNFVVFSLAPGFSPVFEKKCALNHFSGFGRAQKAAETAARFNSTLHRVEARC